VRESRDRCFEFVAPRTSSPKIHVALSRDAARSCQPYDSGGETNRPLAVQSAWDSANPYLSIGPFAYPQYVGLNVAASFRFSRSILTP
jgi:hypothetical protein